VARAARELAESPHLERREQLGPAKIQRKLFVEPGPLTGECLIVQRRQLG
jgi:hypothetical protein